MKSTALFVAALSSSVLGDDDNDVSKWSVELKAQLQDELTKWKETFGHEAVAHGFVPEDVPAQSVQNVNRHSEAELVRYHKTLQDVQRSKQLNPLAEFSALNPFALLSDEEFNKLVQNSFATGDAIAGNTTTNTTAEPILSASTSIDWTTNKCNSAVKDQGYCGSCWAFSSLGTAEFAHCLATGEKLDLSEQQVVDCDNRVSLGCNGGVPSLALDFERNGMCTEDAYPYKSGISGLTGTCQTSCSKKTLTLGTTKRTSGESNLINALNIQPVTVIVEAGNPFWRNYKSGILTQCPGARSDHAVVAVGYGTAGSIDFYKIKNSWGEWYFIPATCNLSDAYNHQCNDSHTDYNKTNNYYQAHYCKTNYHHANHYQAQYHHAKHYQAQYHHANYYQAHYCKTNNHQTNYHHANYYQAHHYQAQYHHAKHYQAQYHHANYYQANYCKTNNHQTNYHHANYYQAHYCKTNYHHANHYQPHYCKTNYHQTNYHHANYRQADNYQANYCKTNYH
ncbi:unnamed protein product [Aphanomyces euteiches]